MRACDDGYPSCRVAESGGGWCKDTCAVLQKELATELAKRDKLNDAYISRTNSGGRTRASTTTFNANKGRVQDRINFLRAELKAIAA